MRANTLLAGAAPTFPGAANPFEVVGHPQRENHGLLQQLLSVLQVRDLIPGYRHAPLDDVSLCGRGLCILVDSSV